MLVWQLKKKYYRSGIGIFPKVTPHFLKYLDHQVLAAGLRITYCICSSLGRLPTRWSLCGCQAAPMPERCPNSSNPGTLQLPDQRSRTGVVWAVLVPLLTAIAIPQGLASTRRPGYRDRGSSNLGFQWLNPRFLFFFFLRARQNGKTRKCIVHSDDPSRPRS